MTLPTFLGIGAQRAGTTWLYSMLRLHPDIFMTSQKELHYFDEKPDLSDYKGFGILGTRPYIAMDDAAGWAWYQAQFADGASFGCRGEITPYYAVLTDRRVALIAQRLPAVKVIYVLRHPVARAWSGFRLLWRTQATSGEYPQDTDLILRSILHPVQLIHSQYERNIGVWEAHIPADRRLYLFYDDLVTQPEAVLHRVCDFLNVAPLQASPALLAEKVNAAAHEELAIPTDVRRVLNDHFADELAFIKRKFHRDLQFDPKR